MERLRAAILSDVHSNYPALQAVDKDIADHSPDLIYLVGDTVGYNTFPRECVQWVMEKANIVVRGNHDESVLNKGILEGQNLMAQMSAIKNFELLHRDELKFLAGLKHVQRLETLNVTLAHANIVLPEYWHYVVKSQDATAQMAMMQTQFLFIGHTHIPVIWHEGGKKQVVPYPHEPIKLPTTRKCVINVGSVGQPRDGDPRACYMIVDFYKRKLVVQYRRVPYEIMETVDGLRDHNLDGLLSRRLCTAG